ncbi:ABC transporter substrate-binding protein [Moritella sp. Urea-trap-13]|uniref:ABC transporter substrate-binding protein n=1 Tax=Moritella sp. Urea-trap-13 TaxID=2058327 RepID=UPI000C32D85D|nr:ABC transporter substrate-binding protein [Moritella sp. Urea-trap-13]PKH08133.1 ABC transporter substrate-binding protein [Moritella sp. Urea-trap-13]
MRKLFVGLGLLLVSTFSQAVALDWQAVEGKAKGQTVYFYAWGGSPEINNYLRWADKRLNSEYGVRLKHVKVGDIAEAITRLAAEKTAKKNTNGSVDMVWVNGENFKSMKRYDLITDSFATQLPNWQYVDKTLPVDNDFSEPTLGLEAPWGVGQLVFIYDTETLSNPPASFNDLLAYAVKNPNKLSYPKPPSFHGTSFLKAALLELASDNAPLYKSVDTQTFATISAPLWDYLDKFHAVAWRQGKQFPASAAETIQLLDDGELDIAISFNPNEATTSQQSGKLSETTVAYAMQAGALSNIHFLSIPWNASAKEGALVAINFLLSPEAQSRKGDLAIWGDPTVLTSSHITGSAKNTKLFKSIPEPHPSWQTALEAEWQKRYGH